MSRRAKMHGQHARTAEVFTNTEIALPRWVGTTKKCARRRRRERQFWFFEHPQWNNAISKKYTFMQWISLVFESVKICNHFLNTPSEIHASDLPLAKFKVARHYAQCHFQQNKQYSSGGVEKTKIVNGNEGGNNKKMWTATRAGTTKLIFSTPPAREAHFRASTIVANEKKRLLWLGWQRHCVVKSRAREKYQNHTWFTIRIRRHMFDESRMHPGGEKPECQQHIRSKHAQKNILAREVLQKPKMRSATKAPSKKKSERHRGRERYSCVLQHPLGENSKTLKK